MALPQPCTNTHSLRLSKFSSQDFETRKYQKAQHIWVCVPGGEPVEEYHDQSGWGVRRGSLQVEASDRQGADSLAWRWSQTGICPVPERFRTRRRPRSA